VTGILLLPPLQTRTIASELVLGEESLDSIGQPTGEEPASQIKLGKRKCHRK